MTEPDSRAVHSPTAKKQVSDLPAQKKILSSFLYKAIIFSIFVALLPLFPSKIYDSNNPTLLSRTWELLHLLLVGIAVSYGLFSQRNAVPDADKDKDAAFKADSPQSYVSRILQISSVFDDAIAGDETRAETWSSLYHSTEPIVVETKPILLPVRNMRGSRVQSSDFIASSSVALPSPIPWRSRSGTMEDEDGDSVMAVCSQTPAFSAKSESFSSELQGKASEDSIRKKSFHGVTTPPAPPPPPPPFSHGSFSERRELKKSFKDELKDVSIKGREGFVKDSSPPLKPEFTSSLRSARTVKSKEAQSVEKPPSPLQQKHQTEAKKKKKVEFMEEIMLDDYSENGKESDSYEDEEAVNPKPASRAGAKENEVDKKADEFIAKFREQIRLQRIQSIKKSSRHRSIKNL